MHGRIFYGQLTGDTIFYLSAVVYLLSSIDRKKRLLRCRGLFLHTVVKLTVNTFVRLRVLTGKHHPRPYFVT